MGKSPPDPPDPKETGAAATGTNIGTAIANAHMGNVNQVTPDGSLNYDQSGSYTYTDPYTGHVYDIPTFTATQTLSPEQQAIHGDLTSAKGNLASIANNSSEFLTGFLKDSVNTRGVPGLAGSAGQSGNIGGNFSTSVGPGFDTGFNRNVGGGFDTSFDRNIGGNFTDQVGLANSYAGADDFSADRQRVEDALWERGSSGRAREDEALRTKLLNSGLREGGAAWNSEMERMGRQNADERIGTMLASGQEQSRLVGMSRDAAQFGNEANMAMANFGNNASMQRAQFGREGQMAQNASAMAGAQFGSDQQSRQNASVMDRFNAQNTASLGSAQFANNANLTNVQFQNAARSQGMSEAYAARAQPINEIIGLMSGSQINQPNFTNTKMPTIPTTDVGGLINENYNQQMQQWQAKQGIMGGIMGGVGSLIGLSDDKAKKDKERIGDVDGEMGLWKFRYKDEPKSQPKHVGLMASEVQKVKPSAVKRGKDGLRRVDYGAALGLMEAR